MIKMALDEKFRGLKIGKIIGEVSLPLGDSEFQRADIKMELIF